jgi:A/G-specific adenine glycosylase
MDVDETRKIRFLQKELLKWFAINSRNFIWRNKSASNYVRIISEVLLQRTRAETVNKYLPIFLKKYSSWRQLGNATEIELIEVLKPLGLSNQRGKRLYNLAQELKKRNGIFPKDRSLVEEMPMMGQYIANAYELFILKKSAPLLDVNMARVLERFFKPREFVDIRYDPTLQRLAKKIVDHKKPTETNWAILDLAALVCKSKSPSCLICPLRKKCRYLKEERLD